MAADYASSGRRRKRATHVQPQPAVPGWIWMLLGLSLGLAVAAAVYVLRPADDGRAPAANADGGSPRTERKAPERVELPPEQKRWMFYDLLEDYELVVPPSGTKDKPVRAVPEPGRYLIQAGSFSTAADAERRRAELALLGIEARVQKVTINGSRTWYRVQIGPLSDRRRLVELLGRLDDNGIEALLVREKG